MQSAAYWTFDISSLEELRALIKVPVIQPLHSHDSQLLTGTSLQSITNAQILSFNNCSLLTSNKPSPSPDNLQSPLKTTAYVAWRVLLGLQACICSPSQLSIQSVYYLLVARIVPCLWVQKTCTWSWSWNSTLICPLLSECEQYCHSEPLLYALLYKWTMAITSSAW